MILIFVVIISIYLRNIFYIRVQNFTKKEEYSERKKNEARVNEQTFQQLSTRKPSSNDLIIDSS